MEHNHICFINFIQSKSCLFYIVFGRPLYCKWDYSPEKVVQLLQSTIPSTLFMYN